MLNIIKRLKAASKRKTLLVLISVALGSSILGSTLSLITNISRYIKGYYDLADMLTTTLETYLSFAGLILMLMSILKFDSDSSEKWFKMSLWTTIATGIFTAIITSIFSGYLGSLILALFSAAPFGLLIVDFKKNHKFIKASCIVIAICAAISTISVLFNLVYAIAGNGLFNEGSGFFAVESSLTWIVMLLYCIRYVKIEYSVDRKIAISLEVQLQELKTAYDEGSISQEEYDTKKNELLQNF